jgi:hypothetical protein
LQSVICTAVARLLVSVPPSCPHCFQLDSTVHPALPSPDSLRNRVHPLISSASSSEAATTHHLLATRERQAPPLGFVSPSRHQPEESTISSRSTNCLTFRPRRFPRPRRLSPLRALRACFIPQPRTRFTFQGFSPITSRAASSTVRSLLSFTAFSCLAVSHEAPDPAARLQGFDPATDPL